MKAIKTRLQSYLTLNMTIDTPAQSSFYFKDAQITKTTNPAVFADPKALAFGSTTDHMVTIAWSVNDGWSKPEIKPFAPLAMDPTASCLHYAIQCFEGMKAYKSRDGSKVRMFRPQLNLARLNRSSKRISLPEFNEEELLKVLERFVAMEARFIAPGGFIYLRPYHIGTNSGLGIRTPTASILGIVSTIMPNFAADVMRLYSSPPDTIRAWPGGFGAAKVGANYGPTLEQNEIAQQLGYHQVLWLFGDTRVVTEAGGSNFVAVWKLPNSETTEIVTCTLENKTILPGITRRSTLEYFRQKYSTTTDTTTTSHKVIVSEREFTIDDLKAAADEGRLIEAFGIGTAFFVSSVGVVRTPEGDDIEVPLPIEGKTGPFADEIRKYLMEITYGDDGTHEWRYDVPLQQ